ncbi:MAG: hydantoinase/oxoprolinase family protein, partial [Oscillospiraceae bacterium]|nr:hydantoinase/oxoprolinase family protein [Oscillospiraceae bacterium]
MRRIRIGIDVGGTFTDAAAIDEATLEVIAREKLPTTHDAKEGVAAGIVRAITGLLEKNHIAPQEVVFIAHGTTQATNALLEGDVARVGVLALGGGLFAERVKSAADVGDIPLAQGKALHTNCAFVETEDAEGSAAEIDGRIRELAADGAEVIVATEAFGVDDPSNEEKVMALARAQGLYATGGHEVSRLYGLRTRTRTAAVNAGLIPRMMETADMTEACVVRSGIGAPLMIMRCDGGVMTTAEVRRRPILTMLSGLAAGVAGVLMYERLSDGIFLEAGGTSTDISVVRGGRVMVRYSEVGGHKTCVSALDVRTLGVAGGSMIRVEHGRIVDVGPRSAHIAGLAYEAFSPSLDAPTLELIAPCSDDAAVYATVQGRDGRCVALT